MVVAGNPLGAAIFNHYIQQQGRGQFIPFQGGDFQYGNGIGDIFRSIGRFLLPILTSTAGGFIGSAAQGLSEGKSFGEAAKQAIKPSIGAAVDSTSSQIMNKVRGGGRKRKRRRIPARFSQSKSNKSNQWLYKGVGSGRKRKLKTNINNRFSKKPRFLPTNF